jgi:hypothetical protein
MYLVHGATWDPSPSGALGSYALVTGRPVENGELGPIETHRVRAPLTIMSRTDASAYRARSAIAEMRSNLNHLLTKALRHADKDRRFAIETYLARGAIPALAGTVRGRDGAVFYKARIPYPSIRALGITKDDVLAPLEHVFRTKSFSPSSALARYLGGAYPLVEIDDERGIVVPIGRRAPELLTADQMIATDIETYDESERAQIPENVRERVVERAKKSERAWFENAPLNVVWREYQKQEGIGKRRIIMAQTANSDTTWVGTLMGDSPYPTTKRLAEDHANRTEDAVIVAGHSLGSDLEAWKASKTKPFGAKIHSPGRIQSYETRFTLEGRVLLDTEHHARARYPSLRAHDLGSVASYLLGEDKTLMASERNELIERAMNNDPEALEALVEYAETDVQLAYRIASELLPDVIARSQLHNLAFEQLAGAGDTQLSERWAARHHWLYAKRPLGSLDFGKRRFGDERHTWRSFSLADHTNRLFEQVRAEGLGEVTILALHPYQRALRELLCEVPSVREAYRAAERDRWLYSDLESMCALPMFLLAGMSIEPEGSAFHKTFSKDAQVFMPLVERVERQLSGMLKHTRVLGVSGRLLAIEPHDALEAGLENHLLATRLARGAGFASEGRINVYDSGFHSVGASDVRRTNRGDFSSEEREAIGVFEDTILTRGPRAALEALQSVSARMPSVIVRSDTAKRAAYEYSPKARSRRVQAHREQETRPGDRIEIERLSGLWESERLITDLRSAFHGLSGRGGVELIRSYLTGNELAREAIATHPRSLAPSH